MIGQFFPVGRDERRERNSDLAVEPRRNNLRGYSVLRYAAHFRDRVIYVVVPEFALVARKGRTVRVYESVGRRRFGKEFIEENRFVGRVFYPETYCVIRANILSKRRERQSKLFPAAARAA